MIFLQTSKMVRSNCKRVSDCFQGVEDGSSLVVILCYWQGLIAEASKLFSGPLSVNVLDCRSTQNQLPNPGWIRTQTDLLVLSRPISRRSGSL